VLERGGRLQVDEPADRGERLVALRRRQRAPQRRLGVEDRVPRPGLIEVVEDMPPGHVPEADAGTEFVLFNPTDELRATEEAIAKGMEATQAG
jgi:hypothetical protein